MIFDLFKSRKNKLSFHKPDISEFTGQLYPQQPRVKLISNGALSSVLCDNGCSFLVFCGERSKKHKLFAASACEGHKYNMTRRPYDLLCHPRGSFCYASFQNDGVQKYISTSFAPDYSEDASYETAFSKTAVSFFLRTDEIKLSTEVRLHQCLACEQRKITVENRKGEALDMSLVFVFEPDLLQTAVTDEQSRNALCDSYPLELQLGKDGKTVLIGRREKGEKSSKGENNPFLCIGFLETAEFSILSKNDESFKSCASCMDPDKKIALKLSLSLEKGEIKTLHLMTAAGVGRLDASSAFHAASVQAPFGNDLVPKGYQIEDPLVNRVAQSILPQLLFSKRDSSLHLDYAFTNKLPRKKIISMGIPEDIPIVIADIYSKKDKERIMAYFMSHEYFKKCLLDVSLVLLYEGNRDVGEGITAELAQLRQKEQQKNGGDEATSSAEAVSKSKTAETAAVCGGIYVISKKGMGEDEEALLYSSACHIATRSLVRIEAPLLPYKPVHLIKANTGLYDEGFGKIILRKAEIGKNGVEDCYYQIPYNECVTMGGLVITASRNEKADCFEGGFELSVRIQNPTDRAVSFTLAYCNELVLGKQRLLSHMISAEHDKKSGKLKLFSPFGPFCFRSKPGDNPDNAVFEVKTLPYELCCERDAFLCGSFQETAVPPLYEPCAAFIFKRELEPHLEIKIELSVQ